MDGWVTIGTRLDSKQLEKDIKTAEGELKRYEKEGEQLAKQKAKVELDLEDYYKQKELIEQSTDKMLQQAQTEEQVNNVLAMEEESLKSLNDAYSSQLNTQGEINKKIEDNTYQQGLLNNKIGEMNAELVKSKGMDKLKANIADTGKSVEKVTKKITKMALAVFGIRSAFMFVRKSIGTLTENDDKLKADVDYIRTALAYSIEPLVRGIVNLAKRLLFYVGYIIKAWTGHDIFANVNKGLEKSKDGAKDLNKELNKTVAGFDEMNTLNDTSSSSGGGSGVSTDVGQLEDFPIPGWVQWIADNGDKVAAILTGIAAGLVAIKLGASGIMALGIGVLVAGIVLLVQDILDFLKNPTWKKFGEILTDIGIILAGLAIIIGSIPLAVAAAVALIVGLVITNWDTIMGILGGIWKWIDDNVIKPVANIFQGLWNGIVEGVSFVWNFVKTAFSKGGQIFNGLKEGIVNTFKAIVNTLITGINKVIAVPFKEINKILNGLRNTKIPVINKRPFKGLWDKDPLPIPKIPKLAVGGIVNLPSRGVPVGGAITGERGAEGVIPLTNSQQMALLGEAIGRYITVNLTNVTELDGRTIARKVAEVNSNTDFLLNR